MWVLLVIAGLLLGSVAVSRLLGRDNTEPLERHERALAALRDLAEHPRPIVSTVTKNDEQVGEHVRILSDAPAPTRRRRARTRPGGPAPARTGSYPTRPNPPVERPSIARPEVLVARFVDDDAQLAPAAVPARRRRPIARVSAFAAALSLAVVATVAGAAVIVTTQQHSTPARRALRVGAPAPTPAPHPVSTVAASTTTVAVPAAHLVALPTGDGAVTIRGPFTLTLDATGDCWVQVAATNGQTTYEGVLHAGQSQHLAGAAAMTVRLGNSRAITIAVNDTQLDLAGVANTATLRFAVS